jgi:SAM-dependent methyltransferase
VNPSTSVKPLPPPDLCYRVAGTTDQNWFHQSGKITLDLYRRALSRIGRDLTEFATVYDWGCGCGRVLRWIEDEAPKAKLFGSDIDKPAIEWLNSNYPNLRVRHQRNGLPPLPFWFGKFDLILAYSVLTHLDEKYQDAWLSELRRRTKPGSVLLLTISGDAMWRRTMDTSNHPRLAELRGMRSELEERGFLFWSGDGWEQHFPDFYHTTFHSHDYIRRHWSKWFDVACIEPGTDNMPQDVVVLRR